MTKGIFLSSTLAFTVGAAVGALVANYILKTKYENVANEEIDSVKKTFEEKMVEYEEAIRETTEYAGILRNEVYRINHPDDVEEESNMRDRPYVITEDEFSHSENPMMPLIYCADGVLLDEDGYFMDVEDSIGSENMDAFDHYEDDVMYVRNDKKEIDYEVVFDERDSVDVVAALRPGPREDEDE